MIGIFLLLVLIIINGLVVLSEIALIAAKKSKLEQSAAKGDANAKTALKLQEKPEVFLSTSQIFITVIAILEGVYSAERFNKYLAPVIEKAPFLRAYADTIATVIIVMIVTFFSIIFGELLPKRIAMIKAEKIAKGTASAMYFLSRATHPIVWVLSGVTNLIFKIFNIKQSTDNKVTEEEIKAMVFEGSEHGAIEEEEKEIIERVFHLGDRNITSLMTHRTDIVWFDINEDKTSIKNKIQEYLHSVYPLCDGDTDNIKGVVYIKDMYLQPDAPLNDLCKKALFVPENNTAYQVLEKFKKTKIHYAFIVDEYGTMHGMITINDILKAIVGEMPEDEDDDYAIVERKDGTYLIDAQIQFYDFLTRFEKTDWMNDGEQEFDTLAGFILHELKHIPGTGETFEWRGFEFEIIDMDGQRIDKVLVKASDDIKEEMED
ncbi:MAG: HlyC/CorC family transporter [Chitinophagaceae bacterium]|nr:HlyC/CorC family transporter [Chitinophagaceae bacterium]